MLGNIPPPLEARTKYRPGSSRLASLTKIVNLWYFSKEKTNPAGCIFTEPAWKFVLVPCHSMYFYLPLPVPLRQNGGKSNCQYFMFKCKMAFWIYFPFPAAPANAREKRRGKYFPAGFSQWKRPWRKKDCVSLAPVFSAVFHCYSCQIWIHAYPLVRLPFILF